MSDTNVPETPPPPGPASSDPNKQCSSKPNSAESMSPEVRQGLVEEGSQMANTCAVQIAEDLAGQIGTVFEPLGAATKPKEGEGNKKEDGRSAESKAGARKPKLVEYLTSQIDAALKNPPQSEPPEDKAAKLVQILAKKWNSNPFAIGILREYIESPHNTPAFAKQLKTALVEDTNLSLEIYGAMGWQVPFPFVYAREREEIGDSRKARKVADLGDKYVGLAFSGGGIRSATFNLGVLQALAKLKILPCVDYLSTVSGGGYIGGWLLAWLKREPLESVMEGLDPDGRIHECKPTPQIEFLRDYSNYLTPQVGFLTADTWTAVATVTRNLLLNLAILVSAAIALLLVPYILVRLAQSFSGCATFVVSQVLLLLALGTFAYHFQQVTLAGKREQRSSKIQGRIIAFITKGRWLSKTQGRIIGSICPFWFTGVYLETCWIGAQAKSAINPFWNHFEIITLDPWLGALVILYWFVVGLVLVAEYSERVGESSRQAQWGIFVSSLLSYLILSFIVVTWVLCELHQAWPQDGSAMISLGVPIALLVYLLAAAVQVGLTGMLLQNEAREWTARLGAWVMILGLAWAALFGLVFYGPPGAMWLGAWVGGTVTVAWVVHTVTGVLSAFSGRTGQSNSSNWLDKLVVTAPPVFALGLMMLLSLGIYRVIAAPPLGSSRDAAPVHVAVSWNDKQSAGFFAVSEPAKQKPTFSKLARDCAELIKKSTYWTKNKGWDFVLGSVLFAAFASLLSLRVDINEFSMQTFYRNRLVRCYLGASREPACRRPNPFTGFDPKDDLLLHTLSCQGSQKECGKKYDGPYPILNATLNLNHGRRLAWQERRAESFTFTPLFCGGTIEDDTAYLKTKDYAYPPDGVYLGTAVATCGAAVSPLVGFHYSTAAGFLMTVFNARLGQWMANPSSKKTWNRFGPRFGLYRLVKELFGLTDDDSPYVYLSDGGQFENLGIYELVRRRVKYIIACDAGADPNLEFSDLGNAIRKCRSDFGAEIDIRVENISRDPDTIFSRAHCAVGKIRYCDGEKGVLVYLKASLTETDPTDVLEYHAEHAEFPHQSTADQWFDESQFESYRKLGYHIALTTFEPAYPPREDHNAPLTPAPPGPPCQSDKEKFFKVLEEAWYPPSPAIAKNFTKHAQVFEEIMERVRQDKTLGILDDKLYADFSSMPKKPPQTGEQSRNAFYICTSLIQLMEDVYLDLNLELKANLEHPHNAGWIKIFKGWAKSSDFQEAWRVNHETYGKSFQRFCENVLKFPRFGS